MTNAMIQLMNSSIENQRYILADTHLSYLEIMQMISKNLTKNHLQKLHHLCCLNLLGE